MDTVNPVISKITPLDGTITSVVNPAVTFDVTDTSSGIGSNPSNAIALEINGMETMRPNLRLVVLND